MAKGIMGRRDIPCAQRIQMQKTAEIKAHRDQAALIAMQCACVALNDTEGLGYVRLCRFARRVQELLDEYYSDMELNRERLNRRLTELGFRMDGEHMYGCFDPETDQPVPVKNIGKKVEQHDQA